MASDAKMASKAPVKVAYVRPSKRKEVILSADALGDTTLFPSLGASPTTHKFSIDFKHAVQESIRLRQEEAERSSKPLDHSKMTTAELNAIGFAVLPIPPRTAESCERFHAAIRAGNEAYKKAQEESGEYMMQ